jgi:site-specific DNA-methyltransferase (adenine-specific)
MMGWLQMSDAYMPQSKTDDWATPIDLWNQLDAIHNFDVDAAASQTNHLCLNWYGLDHENIKRRDGLTADWDGRTVWINPPYGRVIAQWTYAAQKHADKGGTVVMLLPSRTDTRWFHEHCLPNDVEFIKGRLKFGGSKVSAPFPSMIVRFNAK